MKEHINHISVEVTSQCNLNCKFCYNIWKIPGKQNFSHFNSYNQARKTLKLLFKIAGIKHVTFTGGEPFLAERFTELVLYARMKKKNVTIITNGSGTNEKGYQQMIDLGVTLFELPIHSFNSEIHDYLTEIVGSWQKSIDSVQYLKKSKANVVVVMVITKANYEHISETLEFINSLGVRGVMLNRFNIGGKGIAEKKNLELNQDQLNFAFKRASETGNKLKLSLTSNVCTPFCFVNPDNFPNIRFGSCSPDVKNRPLTIDIFGNLRFCNHSPTLLGNIFSDNFSDMLNSDKAVIWREIIPDYCNSCKLFQTCMAGCRAAGEQLNLSLNHPDPILLNLF